MFNCEKWDWRINLEDYWMNECFQKFLELAITATLSKMEYDEFPKLKSFWCLKDKHDISQSEFNGAYKMCVKGICKEN